MSDSPDSVVTECDLPNAPEGEGLEGIDRSQSAGGLAPRCRQ